MQLEYPEGATPLEEEEMDVLLLTHITTRGELDRWEQDNILRAIDWLETTMPRDLLNETFVRKLHQRMFGDVWKWAGEFRRRDKNIGIPWWRISTDLKALCDDAEWWIANDSYAPDELLLRFHHRLVAIHPFNNGNGRHARLMTDHMAVSIIGSERFSWGSDNLTKAGDARSRYIAGLKAADRSDYGPLVEFARS